MSVKSKTSEKKNQPVTTINLPIPASQWGKKKLNWVLLKVCLLGSFKILLQKKIFKGSYAHFSLLFLIKLYFTGLFNLFSSPSFMLQPSFLHFFEATYVSPPFSYLSLFRSLPLFIVGTNKSVRQKEVRLLIWAFIMVLKRGALHIAIISKPSHNRCCIISMEMYAVWLPLCAFAEQNWTLAVFLFPWSMYSFAELFIFLSVLCYTAFLSLTTQPCFSFSRPFCPSFILFFLLLH